MKTLDEIIAELKKCPMCGKEVTKKKQGFRNRYCSKECALEANKRNKGGSAI